MGELGCHHVKFSGGGSSSEEEEEEEEAEAATAPDGGWGWVVVLASFLVNLIADGITFSFGVIFVEFLAYFGEGKSKTAWIGSLFMAIPLLSGPIASFLTDRYGCRKCCVVGGLLAAAGFVVSSVTSSIELLFLTFGVVAGFGLSLCYVAAVVIVAYYFDARRSFATGLSVCGSGIGTFLFAPLTHFLLREYGWRGTTLVLAGLFLNLCVCGMLMRDLAWTKARRRRPRRLRPNTATASSADSSSTSAPCPPSHDELKRLLYNPVMRLEGGDERLCTSLLHLPTFLGDGEKVPTEALEMLTSHRHLYQLILDKYPHFLVCYQPPGTNSEVVCWRQETPFKVDGLEGKSKEKIGEGEKTGETVATITEPWWFKPHPHHTRRLANTAYLKDLRVHRHSLTYRGAMLNINRYRLRASSCPDIYRNSMTTIAKEKVEWYSGIWELWYLLSEMLDFTHFANARFSLFALSNFLLYTWYDVPYVYLADNAIERKFSEPQASMLISIIGIINMLGEILLGWAGDRAWVNANLVYALSMALCGGVVALMPLLSSYEALAGLSGAFGFFIAANYSLTSIILVELITLERFTNAYGLLLLVQGVANLIGPPLAGWLYDITGKYDLPFYLSGVFIALSGLLLLVLPCIESVQSMRNKPSEPAVPPPNTV